MTGSGYEAPEAVRRPGRVVEPMSGAREMSDFELRVRGLISVEEYVRRLDARIAEQHRDLKLRRRKRRRASRSSGEGGKGDG